MMKTGGSFIATHDYQLIGVGNTGCRLVYQVYKRENLKHVYAINYDDRQFAAMQGITTLKMGNADWNVSPKEQMSLESRYDHNDFRVFVNSDVMQLNEAFYNKKKKAILVAYLGEKFATAALPMLTKRASKFGKEIHVFILMPFIIGRYKDDKKNALQCIKKVVPRAGFVHCCNVNSTDHNLNPLAIKDYYDVMEKLILKWLENELPITRI